jgi:hypothetical protein
MKLERVGFVRDLARNLPEEVPNSRAECSEWTTEKWTALARP